MKITQYIEIVASSNPRLNAMTKIAQENIQRTLSKKYSRVDITIVDTIQDLEGLIEKKPDLVILGMKLVLLKPELGYDASPKVWLSDCLADNNIEFTGSETTALALEFDKPAAKQRVLDDDLKTPAYFISPVLEPTYDHTLNFPLFIKPTNRGDSKGIDEQSLVQNQQELTEKIMSIHKECDSDALIEEYLSGAEFSVAVIEDPLSGGHLAMPIEIISPCDDNGNVFLTAAIKSADLEQVRAVSNKALHAAVSHLAIEVFKSLEARDYGRIDVRLDQQGNPSFIEANLMPGLAPRGYMSRCFYLNRGMSYEDMIFAITELGHARTSLFSQQVLSETLAFTDELLTAALIDSPQQAK